MAYRERQKISQMTPKGSNLSATDLIEVSELVSGTYQTKSITGQEIIDAAGGGSLDLQQVTDNGNTTTNDIIVDGGGGEISTLSAGGIFTENTSTGTYAILGNGGELRLKTGDEVSSLQNTNVTNTGVVLEFPDKPTGNYTIATTGDIPSLTGYVPYTGATADVDLNTYKLSAKSVYIEGTAGNGHLHLKHQSADATATGQSTALWADTNGDIKWKNDNNYKTILKTSANTADRTYTFPNETCTLTPDSRSLTINGTAQNLSANRTFTVTDANLSMSDITTNNVSITQHGFVPKAPNDTTKFLRGDGTWATAGGGLTIGTTAITSGTVGRILFEGAGNVLQEDSALFWDNTNKRLGVGATPSTSVRLDVRAQGALSTDIAFRVRNSADTFDLLSINGVGLISGRTDDAGGFNMNYQGTFNTTVQLAFNNGNPTLRVAQSTGGHAFNVYASTDNREYLAGLIGKATLAIGANPLGGTIKPNEANTNTLYVFNGTAPTLSATDSFNLYSSDIVAGNAAPHFRTENGSIIKLYKETKSVAAATFVANTSGIANDTATFGGYTIGQIVGALKAQGLLT